VSCRARPSALYAGRPTRLLNRDPEKRLGSGLYGTQNIKNHPFFAKVNWDKLYKRQIEPPYKPHLVRFTLSHAIKLARAWMVDLKG
jgi:hypothetical protein